MAVLDGIRSLMLVVEYRKIKALATDLGTFRKGGRIVFACNPNIFWYSSGVDESLVGIEFFILVLKKAYDGGKVAAVVGRP